MLLYTSDSPLAGTSRVGKRVLHHQVYALGTRTGIDACSFIVIVTKTKSEIPTGPMIDAPIPLILRNRYPDDLPLPPAQTIEAAPSCKRAAAFSEKQV